VIPPNDLRHPVLPFKIEVQNIFIFFLDKKIRRNFKGDPRLLFALCSPCAIKYEKDSPRVSNYTCPHSDDERAFTYTGPHSELAEALRNGYRVTHVYRYAINNKPINYEFYVSF
jgi:hypothetical protein